MAWEKKIQGDPNRCCFSNSGELRGLCNEGTRTEQKGRDLGSSACMCPSCGYAPCHEEFQVLLLSCGIGHPAINSYAGLMLLLWVNRETLNACGMVQGCWVPRCSLTPLLSCGALSHTLRTLQARNPFPVKVRISFRARLLPASVQLAEGTSLHSSLLIK